MSGRSLQLRAVVASALAILLALVVGGTVVDLLVARHNDLRGNTDGPVRGLKLRG